MNKYNITKDTLTTVVEKGLSIAKLAKHFGCGKATVRHYLLKHGMKTKPYAYSGGQCVICSKKLRNLQTKYCSKKCKAVDHGNSYPTQKSRGLKRKLDLIKSMGEKCAHCGYNKNISCLAFHHVDPSKKTMRLDMRSLSSVPWEKIKKEADDCILLCHNCHGELHNPQMNKDIIFSE